MTTTVDVCTRAAYILAASRIVKTMNDISDGRNYVRSRGDASHTLPIKPLFRRMHQKRDNEAYAAGIILTEHVANAWGTYSTPSVVTNRGSSGGATRGPALFVRLSMAHDLQNPIISGPVSPNVIQAEVNSRAP